MFAQHLNRFPLIAILRGIEPKEVVPIGQALVRQGFGMIEVPLNSPQPFDSIERLVQALGPDVVVGAGTVTDVAQIDALARAGGRLVVMPHSDPEVVRCAKSVGMACAPGVSTPTEAIAALNNGADALKLFPAEASSPGILRAWLSVLPAGTRVLPVGGITPATMALWLAAGATGFGLGSALYRRGNTAAEVETMAIAFASAWAQLAAATNK